MAYQRGRKEVEFKKQLVQVQLKECNLQDLAAQHFMKQSRRTSTIMENRSKKAQK